MRSSNLLARSFSMQTVPSQQALRYAGWAWGLVLILLGLTGSAVAQDPNVGIPRFSTQIAGQYDSINPAVSNVLISLPIRDKTGKIPVSLKLLSNFHLSDNNGNPLVWVGTPGFQMFNLVTVAGDLGASVSYLTQQTPFACKPGMFFQQFSNFVVLDETGASHLTTDAFIYSDPSCGATQATVQTIDGSGYTANLTVQQTTSGALLSWTLIDKSGNVRTQTLLGSPVTNTVTDPDGLQVTNVAAQGANGAVTRTLTDSMGQTVVIASSNAFSPGSPATYQYTDVNGHPQTVTVNYSQYTVKTNFGCTGFQEMSGTDFLPSGIVMADGETFQLSYEQTPGNPSAVTGRIAKLTFPLGGSISYSYSGGNNGIYCAFTGATHVVPTLTRKVDDGNGNVGTWTYVNNNTTGSVSPYTVTETDPDNNVTVYTFALSGSSQSTALVPYETQRQIYQGAAGSQNLLKTILTCYNGNFSNCLKTPAGSGVTQTDVYTYLNGSTSPSLVETKYNLAFNSQGALTNFAGTVAEVKEYDFGATIPPSGSPVRDTTTTYGSWNGTSCVAITNIVDHPCVVTTVDSSGTTAAQTRFTYNSAGHPTQVSRLVSGSTYVTSSATYAANGAMNSSTDANGTVTNYTNGACNGLFRTQTQTANLTTSQTWDCNGGVITSTTDANSNMTNYSYKDANGNADPFWRLMSVSSPDGGQTTAAYNLLATPPNITTSELIDSSHTLTQQTNFDGLGRVIQKSVTSDPQGTDFVSTQYDALGHVASVSNPFRTTGDPTYGFTSYQYDALGRVTQVAPPDGAVPTSASACLANNVCTSYSNNTTTVTDQAGNQRHSIVDGLGRLIEVDEPGAAFAGTAAGGTLTINGNLLSQSGVGATQATPGTGSVTVAGGEGFTTYDPCVVRDGSNCPMNYFDFGSVSITVNGYTDATSYGQGSTAASVASGLAQAINNDGSAFVNASASNGVLSLTARQPGAGSNFNWQLSAQSDDPNGLFDPNGSFANPPSSGTLSRGANANPGTPIYDSGTVKMSVGGFSATANYGNNSGQDSSAPAVASDLVGQIRSQLPGSNPPFTISGNGAAITIQWGSVGNAGNVAVTTTSATNQASYFSTPSFAGCAINTNPQNCSSSLSRGQDPYPSGLAHPYVTLYTNNALGNLTCVVQKGSDTSAFSSCGLAPATWRPRSFTYDLLSRLLTANNPESGAISYNYDANGNVLQKTSPAPNQAGTATQTISYCYDVHNRVTGKAYSSQTCANGQLPAGTAAVTYSYDSGTNGAGYLTSLTDQAGSGSYTYDLMGRMATEIRTIANVTKNLAYLFTAKVQGLE